MSGYADKAVVTPITLPELSDRQSARSNRTIDVLADVPAIITVVAGRARLSLRQIQDLEPGDIVTLDRSPDATVDIMVNGHHIARGDVIVLDDTIATRVSELDEAPET